MSQKDLSLKARYCRMENALSVRNKKTQKRGKNIQGGREISTIIVLKIPYNFFFILIFNKLFKFKTLDEWQH